MPLCKATHWEFKLITDEIQKCIYFYRTFNAYYLIMEICAFFLCLRHMVKKM